MNIDITNRTNYNNLLLEIFNCYDVPTLMKIKDELISQVNQFNGYTTNFVRINRLIRLVTAHIEILNTDLSKLN